MRPGSNAASSRTLVIAVPGMSRCMHGKEPRIVSSADIDVIGSMVNRFHAARRVVLPNPDRLRQRAADSEKNPVARSSSASGASSGMWWPQAGATMQQQHGRPVAANFYCDVDACAEGHSMPPKSRQEGRTIRRSRFNALGIERHGTLLEGLAS